MLQKVILVGGLALLSLVTTACGGASTTARGSQFSAATMRGAYGLICIRVTGPGNQVEAVFGDVMADGRGTLEGTTWVNYNGAVSPPLSGTLSYVVEDNGAVASEGFTGHTTRDGEAVLLARVDEGTDPAICLLLRHAAGASAPEGAYAYAAFDATPAGAGARWSRPGAGFGDAVFDGVGTLAMPVLASNADGTQGITAAIATTYAVSGGGFVTRGANGLPEARGTLVPDGSFLIASGGTAGGPGFIEAYIKRPASFDANLFGGTYLLASFAGTPGAMGIYTSTVGQADADERGTIVFRDRIANTEGVTTPMADATDDYRVVPDGTVAIGELEGAVSPDGRFAVLAGRTAAGAPPMILFLARR